MRFTRILLIITGSTSKAEKVPNLIKTTFPKKGVDKFSKKKYISGITKAAASEWCALFVLSPPSSSNEPWLIYNLVMPLSENFQTKTKQIPTECQFGKPNTKPILYELQKTDNCTKF